jgi:hypothetical protein
MRAWLAALVFTISASATAHAQLLPSAKAGIARYEKHDLATTAYLRGLADGILIQRQEKSSNAFCLPGGPSPSVDTLVSMMKVLVAKVPDLEALPIGVVLAQALHQEYPCSPPK